MLRFGKTKVAKEKFYGAKKTINIWDVNVDNIVISNLVGTKTNSKYLIGYLDKVIRPLVLVLPKISAYVKTFKVKDGDKDKNNKLMAFRIGDEKLLEKYKTIWTKIEDLKNTELNALPVYGDKYVKNKKRTYDDKIHTNFCGLNVPEANIECDSFTVISIASLLAYENKYYLQIYLNNCAYNIVGNQIIDYLGDNPFETGED